jgi:hypothetical protein
LEIDGGEAELRELYERAKAHGVQPEFTADHVISKSVYLMDPDGNRIELFAQQLSPIAGKQTIRDASAAHDLLKPYDMEAAVV